MFAVAFTLSGFSALAYQIAWQRVLTQVIGSDAVSVVLTVSLFMIWLGVGAELARRLLPRIRDRAGLTYAAIETVVGITGISSIPILRAANRLVASAGYESLFLDIVLNVLLLAVPVIGMGMTTPFIVEIAKHRLENLGRTIGRFYGLNILGAAMGALVTGLVLIEIAGLFGVTVIAAALNLVIGASVFFALRKSGIRTLRDTGSLSGTSAPAAVQWKFRIAAVMFGFGTIALQIIYFRILSNYFTLSVIVFPAVLCGYLALMASGQMVGGRLADRYPTKLPAVAAALFVAGSLCLLAAMRFPPAWAAELGVLTFTSFNGQLVSDTFPNLIGDPSPLLVLLFSLVFMIAVVFWTALFPLTLRLMTRDITHAGDRFATVYALYTIGNVAGGLIAGLAFLEWFGTGGTAAATIVVTAIGAFALASTATPGLRRRIEAGVATATTITVLLVPLDYYFAFSMGRYQITDVFEGRTGVATVLPTGRFYKIIDINRTASASALVADPSLGDLYEAWRWNHTELFALDPAFRPRQVLIIGIGHAYLIDALLDLPFVEKITVVEISQEIVDAVRTHTRTGTSRIFSDNRVEIVIADGRRFVQKAKARGDHYDLIQTKINEPWHAGSGNLFTVEFFRSQKEILAPGGYLGVRPHIGHVVDGLRVFDQAVWPGYYHLFFKNGDIVVSEAAVVTPDIAQAWRRLLPGRADAMGIREPTLSVLYLPCCGLGEGVPSNTDDRPTFEYDWLARTFGSGPSPRTTLWNLNPPMLDVPVVESP